MYIIYACAKTPEIQWGKQEKAITKNVIIVPMKNPCEKKIKEQTLSLC
jgi:hypothetical protein